VATPANGRGLHVELEKRLKKLEEFSFVFTVHTKIELKDLSLLVRLISLV